MNLVPRLIRGWPKLAWVAVVKDGAHEVTVLHGPMVEANDRWCVEAVWAGEFAEGDFDLTDLVFGTGVRCRDKKVLFVTSGTGVDRLWFCSHEGLWHVSNSLPALLACTGLSLQEDYTEYDEDAASIMMLGLKRYKRSIPAAGTDIGVVYFNNLSYDGQSLREVEKPDPMPRLGTFRDYYEFLVGAARRMEANLGSAARRYRVVPLASISSGYDSPAGAVIARYAGCTQAVTIRNATTLWRGSDDGTTVARLLNMGCRSYTRTPRRYRDEVRIWSSAGTSGGLNFTVFDYPEPLCLFFSGPYGDKVWDRAYHDLSEPVGDADCMLGEFRLFYGVFHCVVPWWGIRHAQEIHAIGALKEMEPWTLNTDYDRPIARRIIESAGVPRGTFAIRKKNTASNTSFLWPYSDENQLSFRRYLASRGLRAPAPLTVGAFRLWDRCERLLHRNVLRRLGFRKRLQPWRQLSLGSHLFRWANLELAARYRASLEEQDFRR